MSILLDKELEGHSRIAVWENDKTQEFYTQNLLIPSEDQATISKYNTRRKQEIYSSRYLLQYLIGENIWPKFAKDQYGKPHLKNTEKFISLSHSHNKCAAIISDQLVGIDIQREVKKITSIQHKFVSKVEEEMIVDQDRTTALHLIWGAKECLYKAYGKKEVDFKKHLFISKINLDSSHQRFIGRVSKNDFNREFEIQYELLEEFFLVYCFPITTSSL